MGWASTEGWPSCLLLAETLKSEMNPGDVLDERFQLLPHGLAASVPGRKQLLSQVEAPQVRLLHLVEFQNQQ
jgi:hypothetical protein